MKNYYLAHHKIVTRHTQLWPDTLPYIWKQKEEISVILNIPYDFWLKLDNLVFLSHRFFAGQQPDPDEFLKTTLIPLFEEQNNTLHQIIQRVPEQEFQFLRQELKLMHHIISHTLNLTDRRLNHFIPHFLFASVIENFDVLIPLRNMTFEPSLLSHQNYRALMARYVATDFSPDLASVFDFFFWYQSAEQSGIQRYDAHEIILGLINGISFPDSSSPLAATLAETMVEFRQQISYAVIKERLEEITTLIQTATPGKPFDHSTALSLLSALFLPDSFPSKETVIQRDLSVCLTILNGIKTASLSSDRDVLFSYVYLGEAFLPYFIQVTRFLLTPQASVHSALFAEFLSYCRSGYPAVIIPPSLESELKYIQLSFAREIAATKAKTGIPVSGEEIKLFIDKLRITKSDRARIRPS